MSIADVGSEAVSESAFYGGLLQLRQLKNGYRVAIDPVLLAASLAPDPGSVWLELGCGVGAASLCLLARCPEVAVIGIEIDPALAELARQNAELNGFTNRFQVIEGDVAGLARVNLPKIAGIFTNPPFHDPTMTLSPDVRRRQATHGEHLKDWIGLAARILPHHGALGLIYRADGLARALAALAAARPCFGGVSIVPLWPRAGQAAKRFILSARRESKAPLRLAPGLILHGDENEYSPECNAILRGLGTLV